MKGREGIAKQIREEGEKGDEGRGLLPPFTALLLLTNLLFSFLPSAARRQFLSLSSPLFSLECFRGGGGGKARRGMERNCQALHI